MKTVDWLWILHPALAVVFIYPLIGIVIRLAIQTRQRRVDRAKLPPTTGRDHADLGQWLAVGVVGIVLIALTVVIATKAELASAEGGLPRALTLLLVLIGSVVALWALWRVKGKAYRAVFALLTWIGVLGLGAQPEVWRLSDDPLSPEFWQSHYWAGVGGDGPDAVLPGGPARNPQASWAGGGCTSRPMCWPRCCSSLRGSPAPATCWRFPSAGRSPPSMPAIR